MLVGFKQSLAALVAAVCLTLMAATPPAAQSLVPGIQTQEPQSEVQLPEPLTPEAVRELVSRLSDSDVRALLLRQLDATAKSDDRTEAGSGFSALDFAENAAVGVVSSVVTSIQKMPLLLSGQSKSFGNFHQSRGTGGTFSFIGLILIAIAIGFAVEQAVTRFASGWRAKIDDTSAHETITGCMTALGLRFFLDIIGLLAFFATARIIIFSIAPLDDTPLIKVIMVNLVVLPRLMAAISHFLIAPERPKLRIVHTDDDTARYIHRHTIGLVVLMGLSSALVQFNDLNGVPVGETALGFWLNAAVHIYLCVIVFQARKGLAMMLMGPEGDVTPIEAKIARAYPWFAFWLSIATWVVVQIIASQKMFHLLVGGRHYITMLLLLMAPALDTTIRGVVKMMFPAMTGDGATAQAAYREAKRSYIRIGRVMVFAVVVLIIARIWGLDFTNLASAGLGAVFARRLFEVLLVVALGYLALEILNLWVHHQLAAEPTGAGDGVEEIGGEGGGSGGSRLSTILPLIHGVGRATIIVVFGLVALGSFGIDITPLLAGAGIAGLALGFGAQKLVQDVVSGVFFLFDDAFRTGEYVDIDGTVGTVEKISIRSMQLRHHRGAVHTIPYGEIPKITNYSRDWVIMKLKFTVPFETDINKVKKLFKQIGVEVLADPVFKDDLLQTFKSQGVLEVDDVGIVVRGKFMAKPGKQFTLRKEIYARVKSCFEANGISFARREVRVAIPGLEEAQAQNDDQKKIIHSAAAAGAADAARSAIEKDAL